MRAIIIFWNVTYVEQGDNLDLIVFYRLMWFNVIRLRRCASSVSKKIYFYFYFHFLEIYKI